MANYKYIDDFFLVESTLNIVKHHAGFTSDTAFINKIKGIEEEALGYLASSINTDILLKTDTGKGVIKSLCTYYVCWKLYMSINYVTEALATAQEYRISFYELLEPIKENQKESGLKDSELDKVEAIRSNLMIS